MKLIKRIPKHLMPFLMRGEYKILSSFKNGLYLQSNDQLLYFTHKGPLSALSIQIDPKDLADLLNSTDLKFSTNNSTEVVDLTIDNNWSIDIDKLLDCIEETNPMSAISGDTTPLNISLNIIDQLIDTKGIESLLGRGLGLTPSGDDIISGILLVQHLFMKTFFCGELNLELTNNISGALLQQAIEGRYSEDIIDLLKSRGDYTPYINNILDYGSTSGADLLTGLYYGLSKVKKGLI